MRITLGIPKLPPNTAELGAKRHGVEERLAQQFHDLIEGIASALVVGAGLAARRETDDLVVLLDGAPVVLQMAMVELAFEELGLDVQRIDFENLIQEDQSRIVLLLLQGHAIAQAIERDELLVAGTEPGSGKAGHHCREKAIRS